MAGWPPLSDAERAALCERIRTGMWQEEGPERRRMLQAEYREIDRRAAAGRGSRRRRRCRHVTRMVREG